MATLNLDQQPADARAVLAQGETLEILDEGAVVACLVPIAPPRTLRPKFDADLAMLDVLAARISAGWKDDVSAIEAITDVRRTL